MQFNDDVADKMQIEVVYGNPVSQKIVVVNMDAESSIEQTIEASGIKNIYPEIDLKVNKVGVWNRAAKLTDTVIDLDRIEIYRPLLADPKEVRRRRAEKAKEEGRANKITGGRVKPL